MVDFFQVVLGEKTTHEKKTWVAANILLSNFLEGGGVCQLVWN